MYVNSSYDIHIHVANYKSYKASQFGYLNVMSTSTTPVPANKISRKPPTHSTIAQCEVIKKLRLFQKEYPVTLKNIFLAIIMQQGRNMDM